jgi:hypothetical protein
MQQPLKKIMSWTLLAVGAAFTWLNIFSLINQLGIGFKVLIRGKGLINIPVQINIITPEIDHILWIATLIITVVLSLLFTQRPIQNLADNILVRLATFLFIIGSIAYLADLRFPAQILASSATIIILITSFSTAAKTQSMSKRTVAATFTFIWLLLPLIIEVPTATRWIINGLDGQAYASNLSWNTAILDLQITNVLQPVLPRLFALFAATIPLTILFTPYEKTVRRILRKLLKPKPLNNPVHPKSSNSGRKAANIIFAASVVAAVFIGIYPYLPAVNPTSKMVSVDAGYYYNMTQSATGVDASVIIAKIFQQDHMLYLLLQQGVATLTGSPDLTIRIMPPILALLLTITTYLLILTYSKNHVLSAIASFFTATSFQIIAGVNAGFYANWLALSEINIFLIFFLKAVEKGEVASKYSALSSGMAVVILFTHSATWTVMIASILAYTGIAAATKTLKRHELLITGQIITVNILGELLKTSLLHNQSTSQAAESMTPYISYSNLLIIYQNLGATFSYFLGGAYANSLIIILALIGLAQIVKSRQKLHQILLGFTIICILGTFFTASTMPELLQSRFIYLIPFQLLAAIGFNNTLNLTTKVFIEKTGKIGWAIPVMLQLIIFSQLLSYALRVVGFIYTT